MRSIVFGVGAAAMIAAAGVALGAADPGRRAFEIDTPASPCAPGNNAAVCAATQPDPDAPIATARYLGDPVAPLASPSAEPQVQQALTDPPLHVRSVHASADTGQTPSSGESRPVRIATAMVEPLSTAWKGPAAVLPQATGVTDHIAADAARLAEPVQRIGQSRALRARIVELKDFGQRARVFLFAGNGTRMLAYNFTRDDSGVQGGGWSMERANKIGDSQIGVAWQNSRTRVALVGVERKFNQFFGASMKDQMVAVRLSFFPGRHANAPSS